MESVSLAHPTTCLASMPRSDALAMCAAVILRLLAIDPLVLPLTKDVVGTTPLYLRYAEQLVARMNASPPITICALLASTD